MAEEIKVPCNVWPHRATNANALYDHLTMTNNLYQPQGLRLPNSKDSRICFELAGVIPTNINATPLGILRVYWIPAVGTGTLKLFYDIFGATQEATSLDPSGAGTVTGNTTDTPSAINQPQITDIALTALAASLLSGRWIFGWLERKANTDAADTLEGDIIIPRILFVANT